MYDQTQNGIKQQNTQLREIPRRKLDDWVVPEGPFKERPEIGKYKSRKKYFEAKARTDAWQNQRNLLLQYDKMNENYYNQKVGIDKEFDQQVRDLKNFAAQRNWGRGSWTGAKNRRIDNDKNDTLTNLYNNYGLDVEDINNQLDNLETNLDLALKGMKWS